MSARQDVKISVVWCRTKSRLLGCRCGVELRADCSVISVVVRIIRSVFLWKRAFQYDCYFVLSDILQWVISKASSCYVKMWFINIHQRCTRLKSPVRFPFIIWSPHNTVKRMWMRTANVTICDIQPIKGKYFHVFLCTTENSHQGLFT